MSAPAGGPPTGGPAADDTVPVDTVPVDNTTGGQPDPMDLSRDQNEYQAPEKPAISPGPHDRPVEQVKLPPDVVAAINDPNYDASLEIVTKVAEDTWLVRRRDDLDTQYLGTDDRFDTSQPLLLSLFRRGAIQPFAALLNHPNLISYNGTVPMYPFSTAKGDEDEEAGRTKGRSLTLWDHCDAGSLGGFLERTVVQARVWPEGHEATPDMVAGWLPESLCWHVVTSVLRALAWLHEGYRHEDTVEEGADGAACRGYRAQTRVERREDWLSVLHRGVTPDNIFFQHPKATETYGLCKLGDYSNVYVSGHVNDLSRGRVVCSEDGTAPLLQLIDTLNVPSLQDVYRIPKENRPYYKSTELFHLGEVLYRMMTKQAIPNREECAECGSRHWEEETGQPCEAWPLSRPFQLDEVLEGLEDGYSPELLTVLQRLLASYRGADVDTAAEFRAVRAYYLEWKQGTPEGRRYRDYWDDMVTRGENTKRKQAEDADLARAQSVPGAIDYVQVALEWAEARTRAAREAREAAEAEAALGPEDETAAPTGPEVKVFPPTGATAA